MRKPTTTIRLMGLLMALMLIVSACSSTSDTASTTQAGGDAASTTQAGGDAVEPIELQFFYPVEVAGALAQFIDGYVADFNATHDDIQVKPIFTGNYGENMARTRAAIGAGESPDIAILLGTDLYSLIDLDGIVPLDDFIEESDFPIDDFFGAFMPNTIADEQIWSISWQRSTPVLYYNKDMFAEVGLDPESPPATWEELVEFGKTLTTSDRWGVEVPAIFWIYANFAIQAGKHIGSLDDNPCGVYLDTPEAIEALTFIRSLQTEHAVMPDGVVAWQTAPADFIAGAAAMIYHSTGSLSSILADAPFEVGTAFMPAGAAGFGANVGGGNFYIMKDIPKERQDAAWVFIEWMARTEQMGQWGIDSGYVAPRETSWVSQPLEGYAEEVPQALTARDQLEFAVKEFPATVASAEIAQITTQAIEAVYTGQSSPEEALATAQERADELLVQNGCEVGG